MTNNPVESREIIFARLVYLELLTVKS